MKTIPYLSVISPVYKGEAMIDLLIERIETEVGKITTEFEIILVEDASPDKSWEKIEENSRTKPHVKGVRLSRNFGQHNAISAGMELAKGEYVVLMDCDLQHDPIYIHDMHEKIKEGYDLVYTRTQTRAHGTLKNFTAWCFYKFLAVISNYYMDPNVGSYSMLSRKVVDAYNKYNDYQKAYLWALNWAGFHYAIINIQHKNRASGTSSYSLPKLITHAVNVTVANSDKLLYISVFLGVFFSTMAFFGTIIVIYRYVTLGGLEGWSSLMVINMFFSGLVLTVMGIMGIYLGKIFEQTKNRPRYLINEKINF